ncbi:Uncharacterized protein APZ42_005575, partial [Daphnia magna]
IPKNVRERTPPTLQLIFSTFPTLRNACDPAKAETEWRALSLLSTEELGLQTEDELRLLSAETFWVLVLKLKSSAGLLFPNVAVVITFIFSLSYSNAIAERVFSFLKINRNDRRNCLSNDVLLGLMRTKFLMKNTHSTAATIKFLDKLIDRVQKVRANAVIVGDEF